MEQEESTLTSGKVPAVLLPQADRLEIIGEPLNDRAVKPPSKNVVHLHVMPEPYADSPECRDGWLGLTIQEPRSGEIITIQIDGRLKIRITKKNRIRALVVGLIVAVAVGCVINYISDYVFQIIKTNVPKIIEVVRRFLNI